MSTSGTTLFSPTLDVICEEAAERAGFELRSGYEWRTITRSLNFLLVEWANRGLNLWAIDSGTITLTPGTASYTLPADTVDVVESIIRLTYGTTTPTDLYVERITVSQYAQIPSKTALGRPVQIYINRLETAPVANFWPTPDQPYTYVYWRLRRLQDAGTALNTQDIPFRFVNALVAGLAYMVASKRAGSESRVPTLKAQYDEAWQLAAGEDRDRASFWFTPGDPIYGY